jgi:hypothetical protein
VQDTEPQELRIGTSPDFGSHRIAPLQNCLGRFEQMHACRRQCDQRVPPLEQFGIEFRFKLRNACRDRGLRNGYPLRAFRKSAGLSNGEEVPDLI